jgi:hypothetical protein
MLEEFKPFCIRADYPAYPPYHEGKYLEQYFLDFYFKNLKEFEKLERQYIPVTWTDIFVKALYMVPELQKALKNLDGSKKYFTVSQHDEAPGLKLPLNTLNFSAGGNFPDTVPIPLICSEIKNKPKLEKDIFASFVGSITDASNGWGKLAHTIRSKIVNILANNPDYLLKPKNWSDSIEDEKKDLFLNVTARSKFTLCPRGYGATSFRLYEAMQLGSVPVYIYFQKPHLPFINEINWHDICVLIDFDDIENLDSILKSISEEKYNSMVDKIKEIYPKYFTLESTCVNILKILKNEKNIICNR